MNTEKMANDAEKAVNDVKWGVNDMAERAKEYIREQRDRNEEPTQEGWLNRAKENIKEGWEDTKDAASDAWEKLKDWTVDAEGEVKKATN